MGNIKRQNGLLVKGGRHHGLGRNRLRHALRIGRTHKNAMKAVSDTGAKIGVASE
jgi:hypothetical protein